MAIPAIELPHNHDITKTYAKRQIHLAIKKHLAITQSTLQPQNNPNTQHESNHYIISIPANTPTLPTNSPQHLVHIYSHTHILTHSPIHSFIHSFIHSLTLNRIQNLPPPQKNTLIIILPLFLIPIQTAIFISISNNLRELIARMVVVLKPAPARALHRRASLRIGHRRRHLVRPPPSRHPLPYPSSEIPAPAWSQVGEFCFDVGFCVLEILGDEPGRWVGGVLLWLGR